MAYSLIYVFLEGVDDERFVERVVQPLLEERYDCVKIVRYAELRPGKIGAFLNSIRQMKADYLFLADLDGSPCVTNRKEIVCRRVQVVEEGRVIVVAQEIEGWYLAGLDGAAANRLSISQLASTDELTKEQFNQHVLRADDIRADRMREILDAFSLDTAKKKNRSLAYACGRCGR